ncbi:hypothetical protein DRP77_04725 [Candidatus Poribacteria bacterium]|nr:MAG: hypothetical protein DRP77_04725 [Candidatus Poribacteria bacterium]
MGYRERLLGSYATTHSGYLENLAWRRKRLPRFYRSYFLKHLPQNRSAPILDVGCGPGDFLLFLQDLGYTDVRGIDLSEEQVEIARRRGARKVEVAEAIEYLRGHKGEFELIAALDLLEHFPKERVLNFLEAAREALKEGGKLILTVPNMSSPFGTRIGFGDFTHESAFTPSSLSQVMRAAGFEVEGIYPCEPVIYGFKSAVRWAIWKVIEKLIRLYVAAETGVLPGEVFTQVMYAVGRRG